MPVNTAKAKDSGSSDKVVFGGETTDNSIAMTDQLKNMKSFCAFGIMEAAETTLAGGMAGGIGGTVIGAGTSIVRHIIGSTGGPGFIASSLIGGAIGTAAGGTLGLIGGLFSGWDNNPQYE